MKVFDVDIHGIELEGADAATLRRARRKADLDEDDVTISETSVGSVIMVAFSEEGGVFAESTVAAYERSASRGRQNPR